MTASVDQRDDVVELPERAAGYEAKLSELRSATTAADSPAQPVGIEPTSPAHAAVALSGPSTRLAGIALVVGIHTGRVPTTAAIDLAPFRPGLVQDRISAPAADSPRYVRKANLGTPVPRHRTVSLPPQSAGPRSPAARAFSGGVDWRVVERSGSGRRRSSAAARLARRTPMPITRPARGLGHPPRATRPLSISFHALGQTSRGS
jgi:hypothetical protein